MVKVLDLLRVSESNPKSTEEILVNILTTTHIPPVFRFVCHVVFQDRLHHSCNESTSKRIEIKIREDNGKTHLAISGGSSCESHDFTHGFNSEDKRKSILIMMSNQTKLKFRFRIHHSP